MTFFIHSLITNQIMSIIDVMLIIFLCILLYRYLKGSVAFYILIGLLLVYFLSIGLHRLGFRFLSDIINQITSYGLLFIAIIFQPEIRKIFLSIGNNKLSKQILKINNNFLSTQKTERNIAIRNEIMEALIYLSNKKLGGTIVLSHNDELTSIVHTGVEINSEISGKLIESIFVKKSPLHDGAIIIQNGMIRAASCTLPVSENRIKHRVGLRHKSAKGISESTASLAIVVSETTSKISYALQGKLYMDKSVDEVAKEIDNYLKS